MNNDTDNQEKNISELREKVQQKTQKAKSELAGKYAELSKKADHARESADLYIKENPAKSVMIAAGVGVLAGALLVSLMRKR